MSTEPIRLVIAGLGAIALNQYLPQIREMHGVEVVARVIHGVDGPNDNARNSAFHTHSPTSRRCLHPSKPMHWST